MHYNRNYSYTVTGLMNGHVKVWRLPLYQASSNEYIMIHNCIFHTKQVESIIAGSDDRTIISYSSDLTLCLWSL